MGLFKGQKSKKSPKDEIIASEQRFFDENFREELRNHGRWYFEKVISENGALFKQELEATVARVNDELKDHVTSQLDASIAQLGADLKQHVSQQLDGRFAEYDGAVKTAQDSALESINHSAQAVEEQHKQLTASLQKSLADQEALLADTHKDIVAQVNAMKDGQGMALQLLTQSTQAMQQYHQQLASMLQKSLADQQAMLVQVFEQNMAQIIEHYLLKALGDEYDLKAQLPAIIKQMETNKQAIVDDMKL